jgi:nitrite reductase/ring-hydroxylating ferredoxin subunit
LRGVEHDVGAASEFPLGSKRILDVSGRSIGLFNVGGELHAVLNSCPHALAPICLADLGGTWLPSRPGDIQYGLEGRVLRCIWHGWEFDIQTGRTVAASDRRRLSKFPVRVLGGRVLVTVPNTRDEPDVEHPSPE